MDFEIQQELIEDGIAVFRLSGALNHTSYEQLKQQLTEKFESSNFNLILDLSQVTQISSIALGSLFTHQQLLSSHSGTMVLCGCPVNILAIFKMLSMDETFQICNDIDDARDFFLSKLKS